MKARKIHFLVVLLFAMEGFGQNDSLQIVTPGLQFTYRVSYGPFRIGTVRYEIMGSERTRGRMTIRSRIFLDSNPAFIFIRLHSMFEALTDSTGYSVWMRSVEESDQGRVISVYRYEPDRSLLYMEEQYERRRGRIRVDSLQITEPYFDGLSLAYLARRDSRKKYIQRFPTIADFKIRGSMVQFEGVMDTVFLRSLGMAVNAYRVSGKVDLGARAMAGLSGKFKGWFSVDPTATPLRAEVKIFIGRVVLELEEVNRPQWPE